MVNPDSIHSVADDEQRNAVENNVLNVSIEWQICELYQRVFNERLPWNWNDLYFNGDAEVVAKIRALFQVCMHADYSFSD